MSTHPRVVSKRRASITALPLYYSGHLQTKFRKEKDFKKCYAELRGTVLFLYKDETQDTYTEKLDLKEFKSMELDSPYQRKAANLFTLTLHSEVVQLKMDNLETGEEWKSYILTVIKKEILSKVKLLPGQVLQLQEVLTQEIRRNAPTLHPPLPPLPPPPPLPPRPSFLLSTSRPPSKDEPDATPGVPPDVLPDVPPDVLPDVPPDAVPEVPACFFNVTRQEAERMLEANPEHGNMILRPSTLVNNYALTLRQVTASGSVMKNYRVTCTSSGFVIELDTAVIVSSLNDVLKYFLEKTEHRLQPYKSSQHYDTCIDVSPAPNHINTTSPTPKTIPKAHVAPMTQPKTTEKILPPPPKPMASEYVVPDDHCPDEHNIKLAQMDEELRGVLKFQRDAIYSATDMEEEEVTYENQTSRKSLSSTAESTV